ncbi:MAG: hypothetical protein CMO43_05005 [Verrucomicrobiales bacterium]|jgi:hypothetical protein|nr:hypothetical protein [Verrucomicrobiales bacterium]MDP6677489.1 hypothetical protein [Verrucomicrobiota bacterium]MDP6752852.1 hypothetical protein [Verrucomicrobiota bacterium]MDP7012360.1 hypothetical protein [Verrucomicrobiota bacterium]
METLGIDAAGMIMWDAANTRLAEAAHQLAQAEPVIEPPVDALTAGNESEIATLLIQAASDLQQYSLNILA